MKRRMLLKKIISLLAVSSMVLALAGCGGDRTAGSGGSAAADKDDSGGSVGLWNSDQESGGGPAVMGRYIEEEIDLTEQAIIGEACRGIRRLSDNSLVILNTETGFVVSEDEGFTWEIRTPEWLSAIQEGYGYVSAMDLAPDGTVMILYDEDSGDGKWDPLVALILPDGVLVPAEAALDEEEKWSGLVSASDDGRYFAVTTQDSIYEIYRDGSTEKFLTPEPSPDWMQIQGGLLFLDSGLGYGTMPAIYELETGNYVEDTVLLEFVESVYGERGYNSGIFRSMCLLPGEEQTVYTVGGRGIHRHVIGGNMMEQVVDGSLSMLGNPNYLINSAIRLEGDAFLVLFSNGKLLRFTYDPDVSSVPENILTVYSLREDSNVRQAIAGYQSRNPDVFVSYTVGMADGGAVTREDAIKKLNTQIMAGTGPDLLVMDDLPIRSYVEKGLLLDLTGHLAACSEREPLFDNLIDALKIEEKAYMTPASFSIPMLIGEKTQVSNVTGMSDMADRVERMRREKPGEDIIGMVSEQEVLSRFATVSAPAWVDDKGQIDRQALGEFLEQCSRIYSAQMYGLDGNVLKKYKEREIALEAMNSRNSKRDWRETYALFDLISGTVSLVSSRVDSGDQWIETVSIDRNPGFEEYQAVEMRGQCGGVFCPQMLLSVSTASNQTDAAFAFLDYFLLAQTQSGYDGFPVNKEAFDVIFTPKEGYVAADGGYSYLSVGGADGVTMQYTGYWPTDAEVAALKEQFGSLQTAYIPDSMLEDVVFEQGAAYMQGQQSLELALSEIEKKIAIYMAE